MTAVGGIRGGGVLHEYRGGGFNRERGCECMNEVGGGVCMALLTVEYRPMAVHGRMHSKTGSRVL